MKRMVHVSFLLLSCGTLLGAQLLLSPDGPGATPYASSLSETVLGTMNAKPCENKGCSSGLKGTRRCKISKTGVNCSTDSLGRCGETPC